ncbi:MAG TPA: glutathione S-transferase C-terminal domain-containing protein [Streptosporangiaceae bacterium]|nr:glutathione S-transferase C-terminal domain-containing protein [Streptosporangiaceae bacterium]
MTATSERTAGHGASPVDFGTYGDYGDYKRGKAQAAKAKAGAEAKSGAEAKAEAEFVRAPYPFRDRITADGSSGHPAEAGRYHLYVSWACPWAQRTAIVRKLLGLEDVISLSVVDPIRDGRGWAFRTGPDHGLDELNGFQFIREAYEATEPGYDGHISVPVLWDKHAGKIVSNNFPDITIDLGTQFGQWADPSVELYPASLRPQIDELNEVIYTTVNNGVYRSGFAMTQDAYHEAVTGLFGTLDSLELRLADRRYLMGSQLTEADVRLWVTLARFDSVYYSHFKCSIRRLTEYRSLWGYARDLYSIPAFSETTNFDHIKRHYFMTHSQLNPRRIVPEGPMLGWTEPHDRAAL